MILRIKVKSPNTNIVNSGSVSNSKPFKKGKGGKTKNNPAPPKPRLEIMFFREESNRLFSSEDNVADYYR